MAQDPKAHADAYGLSQDVAAEYEAEEGPPSGAHHGETRTRIAEHADNQSHGPKTLNKIRSEFAGGADDAGGSTQ